MTGPTIRPRGRIGHAIAAWSLAGLVVAGGPESAPWHDRVHPLVLEQAARGAVEFIVVLRAQADLGPAAGIAGKAAKGRFVYEALTTVAADTQPGLLALIDSRQLEHRRLWIVNAILVHGDSADVAALASRPEVQFVDANPTVHTPQPEIHETDEEGSAGSVEWGIQRVGADLVWAMGYDGSGVVVGGQDTGYDWDHPALIGQYRGWDGTAATHDYNWHDAIHAGGGVCGPDAAAPCDDSGHGTHTMGTMVGDDGGANRIGMSPGARWIGCRNMDQGNGTPATYSECFQWFVAPTDRNDAQPDPSRAPHVINNSWVCPPSEGCSSETLRRVVENTRAAGIVVVASAGNAGNACSSVGNPPATYEAAFSVGATSSTDAIASFSSRGPVTVDGSGRLKPDVSAPGVSVRSSVPGGGYGNASGTSMAGPHVAGLVALLLDARPDLAGDVDGIEWLIERSTQTLTSTQTCGGISGSDVPNNTFGYGRIDALRLLTGDADLDGTANLHDCRPTDGTTWLAPSPIDNLLLVPATSAPTTVLYWTAQNGGTSAPRFDVLRSERARDFSKAVCLETDSTAVFSSDDAIPDEAFYYLIRVRNACGSQQGSSSAGAPRKGGYCLLSP